MDGQISRKNLFLAAFTGIALPSTVRNAFAQTTGNFSLDDIAAMERVIGFSLTADQRKSLQPSIKELRDQNLALSNLKLPNWVAPAFAFHPVGRQPAESKRTEVRLSKRPAPTFKSDDDLAFMSVADLGVLLRKKQVTSVQLTELCLRRLKTYGPKLLCVIDLLEERAMREAKQSDEEIAKGKIRGPLHGIPYGIKDLFSTSEGRTTWGAGPYRDQKFNEDSAVVEKLRAAGAVLCAKLSLGALAMNDVWFEGTTKNPWNPAQGSSGSSAGSACSVAAGLLPFAIGTETLGSIVSPSHRCRVTGLRPTFGRVSRYGAMALSWTMDKVGPIVRFAQDAAPILAAIHGKDPRDTSTVDRPFSYRPDIDFGKLKIAVLQNDTALDEDDKEGGPDEALKILKSLGVKVEKVKFTPPLDGADYCLSVEAAAAFDELTRGPGIENLKNSMWPAIFRANEFGTGVSYVQSMRARTRVMETFEKELAPFDAVLTSDRGSFLLITTNLTGHPQLYVPMGNGRGVSLIGHLYDEGLLIALGEAIQAKTGIPLLRPDLTKLG